MSGWTYGTLAELVEKGLACGDLAEAVIQAEMELAHRSRREVLEEMELILTAIEQITGKGMQEPVVSLGGLVGGEAQQLDALYGSPSSLAGPLLNRAMARAMAVAQRNTAMGRVVACPTAGPSGIVPGLILTVAEAVGAGRDRLLRALFVAGGVGVVIALNASLSGAEGGCQAEAGSAAAMAAGAAVYLAGGSEEQVINAAALALKNHLGLACDPVAGLVEVPCLKRNALSTAVALAAAEMALAGIRSVIPPDEVILAAAKIGLMLPREIRETAGGGLAMTPTGLRIKAQLEQEAGATAGT